jgi:serine/threonine protein phosphatase PrpC
MNIRAGLVIAGGQIQGARRRQEDAFAIEELAGGARLVLVADGLGGLPAGDVASREASQEFVRVFRADAGSGQGSAPEWMRHALGEADAHLHRRQSGAPELVGMSTTIVALRAQGHEACALSVGDSYLMLLRHGMLYVLNDLHREGSALTSCLGAQLTQVWAVDGITIEPGDRFVLATDGITTLGEATIKERVAAAASAKEAVDGLLGAIEDAAALHQDNATVVALIVP